MLAVDTWAIDALRDVASPGLTRAMWAATLAGNVLVATVHTLLAATVLAAWGRWRSGVVLAVSVAAATAASDTLKGVLGRPRPPAAAALIAMPSGESLPSGHALATVVLYVGFALLVTLDREAVRARAVAVGVALLAAVAVGASRVYLGVHWPSDVLASWLVGAVILVVSALAASRWDREGSQGLSADGRRAASAAAAVCAIAILLAEMWRNPLA